ncbi:MAG TPA: TonB-dependent receptor [Candidatus Acidoferrum sp.]|nr:TonB-dependent receptor [Candidatus Acidoferrum sp.]
MAQQAASQDQSQQQLEEVMITGSRVRVTSGMETPNPVTVVTMDQLALTSPTTMIDGMAQLPQFAGSTTTANQAGFFTSPGAGSLSLRGLQTKRTLTLLDGRRVVSSTIYGGPDINLFPEQMMKSVETVTGGATAAYGTDAVSGVVNFKLDTKFKGYRGTVQMGENYNGDNQNYKFSISGGWDLTDKAHLLLSTGKFNQDGIYTRQGYDWYKGYGLLTNPSATAGQTPDNPVRIPYTNVVSRHASYDGVIEFPAASGISPYIMTPSGVPTPLTLGTASDTNFTNGGNGTDNGVDGAMLQPKTSNQNLFGYLEYQFNDNLKGYVQAMYGNAYFKQRNFGGLFGPGRSFTIYSGNPFIPADIQTLMTQKNVPSITVGYIGSNSNTQVNSYTDQNTDMVSWTTGFDYQVKSGFFSGWSVDGYAQRGRTNVDAAQKGGMRIDRMYLAVDAVKDSTGKIVCNVTKTSGMYADCVPYNVFGRNSASAAAVDWVTGFDPGVQVCTQGWLPNGQTLPYCYTGDADKHREIALRQDVWELSANGELFKGWGAGPISMAVGYDWREEGFVQYVQAPQGNPSANPSALPVAANNAALGIRGVPGGAAASGNSVEFQFSKVPFGLGSFKVNEAFTEFRVPLLSGIPFIKQLDFDAAGRWARYSGSGDVASWKGSLEWQVLQDFRMRSTISQDVRAATLGERYDRTGGAATVIDRGEDPAGAAASNYGITTVSGGNPNVKPERAKTFTVGFVYQPRWLQGFQTSVDWYNVDIHNNIAQLGVQAIVDRCYLNGDVDACKMIERDGPASTIKPGLNRISIVNDVYTNINSQEAQGIDFEATYRRDIHLFGGGEVATIRLLSSYLQHNTSTNSVGLVTHAEGVYGLPKWNTMLSGSYNRGPLDVSLQVRYNSATVQALTNNIYQSSLGRVRYDIPDWVNTINSSTLVDARVSYNFQTAGVNYNVFLSINNLFNRDPQTYITAPDGALAMATGNGAVGDLIGRRFVLGVNFDF